MNKIFEAFHYQWGNGGKGLIQILVVLFVALLMVTGVNAYDVYERRSFNPLGYYSLQTVDNPRNADGIPVVHVGERLLVTGVKCANQDATVFGRVSYRTMTSPFTNILGSEGVSNRSAGCETLHYSNILPPNITPGLWQIIGLEVVNDESLMDVANYKSEPFLVENP